MWLEICESFEFQENDRLSLEVKMSHPSLVIPVLEEFVTSSNDLLAKQVQTFSGN